MSDEEKHDISTRLALLERASEEAKQALALYHDETKGSLASVHKRIPENEHALTGNMHDLSTDLRSGWREILTKLDLYRLDIEKKREDDKRTHDVDCKLCLDPIKTDVAELKKNQNILAGAWAAVALWLGLKGK